MGGRGASSGGGAGGGVRSERTGHLADDYVGFVEGVNMLMKETGMSYDEATDAYYAMRDYFGTGYKSIRAGDTPNAAAKAKLIDEVITNSRSYDGTIYRGISLSTAHYDTWSKNLEVGSTIDMQGISSWSSKASVASKFASGSSGKSVIFTVKSTKYASPVQHLSHYGSGEAEVLAPSYVKYTVSSYTVSGNVTKVILEELG